MKWFRDTATLVPLLAVSAVAGLCCFYQTRKRHTSQMANPPCSLFPGSWSPFPDSLLTAFRYHQSMSQFPPGQTLLIDADDTLWENNVYFERAIASFISYLNHHEYSPAEVREQLNAVERETILEHGYGISSFTRSLVTCFERLSPAPVTDEKRQRV